MAVPLCSRVLINTEFIIVPGTLEWSVRKKEGPA